MATLNPLEQKARSSFIKGLIIGLLLTFVVGGILVYQLNRVNTELKSVKATIKQVYALNRYVKSGWILTQDMFTQIKTVTYPADAFTDWTSIQKRTLQDANGREIKFSSNTFFIGGKYNNDGILEGAEERKYKESDKITVTVDNQEIPVYYTLKEDGNVASVLTVDPKGTTDDRGRLLMYSLVLSDGTSAGQLIATLDSSRTTFAIYANAIAKVDMSQNTIVTPGMITTAAEKVTDDMRESEFAMILLPSNLEDKDIIDIRLRLADGTDYVVLPKKTVSLIASGGTYNSKAIRLKLSETERLIMNCAIIDKYQIGGSAKLYALRYTDAGVQESAKVTYIPSGEVAQLVNTDPNQVEEIKARLVEELNASKDNRAKIDSYIAELTSDEKKQSIEAGTSQELSAQQALRDSFVSSLTVSSSNGLQ